MIKEKQNHELYKWDSFKKEPECLKIPSKFGLEVYSTLIIGDSMMFLGKKEEKQDVRYLIISKKTGKYKNSGIFVSLKVCDQALLTSKIDSGFIDSEKSIKIIWNCTEKEIIIHVSYNKSKKKIAVLNFPYKIKEESVKYQFSEESFVVYKISKNAIKIYQIRKISQAIAILSFMDKANLNFSEICQKKVVDLLQSLQKRNFNTK